MMKSVLFLKKTLDKKCVAAEFRSQVTLQFCATVSMD